VSNHRGAGPMLPAAPVASSKARQNLHRTEARVAEQRYALRSQIPAIVLGARVTVITRLVEFGGQLDPLPVLQLRDREHAGFLLLVILVVGLACVDGEA
jgi:hypothetical protein